MYDKYVRHRVTATAEGIGFLRSLPLMYCHRNYTLRFYALDSDANRSGPIENSLVSYAIKYRIYTVA